MIEFLQIRDFRTHKESELEFSPGVNVIVGESDSGKTNIMRALWWIIFGKPSGESVRRHNAKLDCEVTIETETDCITRVRGKTINQYILNDDVYTGFGQSVPEPIVKAFNINELNFMRQLDPPFLLSKTAGEVAQYMNRLINLDIIDTSLGNIKRMTKEAERASAEHNAEVARLENALAGFDWTDAAEKDVAVIEKKQAKLDRKKNVALDLIDLLDREDDLYQEKQKHPSYAAVLPIIDKLIQRNADLLSHQMQAQTLRNALLHVKQAQAALSKAHTVKGADKAIDALNSRVLKQQKKAAVSNNLTVLLECVYIVADNLKEAIAQHKQSAVLLKNNMPNTCPLCEQEIK